MLGIASSHRSPVYPSPRHGVDSFYALAGNIGDEDYLYDRALPHAPCTYHGSHVWSGQRLVQYVEPQTDRLRPRCELRMNGFPMVPTAPQVPSHHLQRLARVGRRVGLSVVPLLTISTLTFQHFLSHFYSHPPPLSTRSLSLSPPSIPPNRHPRHRHHSTYHFGDSMFCQHKVRSPTIRHEEAPHLETCSGRTLLELLEHWYGCAGYMRGDSGGFEY